jgi:phage-related tail fiber protein
LFAAIGVEFGFGDGVNTFNLPDLRGEFIRGWDKGRGVDAGRTFGSWQKSSVDGYDPSAQHPGVGGLCEAEANDLDPDASLRKNGFDVVDVNLYQGLYVTGVSAGSAAKPGTLNGKLNTGGWALGGSKPRNVALLPCIKF